MVPSSPYLDRLRLDTAVEISLYFRGEQALVSVRDQGPGVPEATLSEMYCRSVAAC